MIRLHVTAPLADGHAVAPTLDQSRYLTQVMRLKQSDDLLLFNGKDGEWRAEVVEVLKKGAILRCVEQTRPQVYGPDLELILAGIKLRDDLGGDMGTLPAETTGKDAAFTAARTAATGDDALLGMIDDIEAEGSRRMKICSTYTYGGNYCY